MLTLAVKPAAQPHLVPDRISPAPASLPAQAIGVDCASLEESWGLASCKVRGGYSPARTRMKTLVLHVSAVLYPASCPVTASGP
jgi:hypothetical protein